MNLLCKGQTENTSPHQNINNLLSIIARLFLQYLFYEKQNNLWSSLLKLANIICYKHCVWSLLHCKRNGRSKVYAKRKSEKKREKRNYCEDKFYIKVLAATGVLNSSFFALWNCSGQASNSFKDISWPPTHHSCLTLIYTLLFLTYQISPKAEIFFWWKGHDWRQFKTITKFNKTNRSQSLSQVSKKWLQIFEISYLN